MASGGSFQLIFFTALSAMWSDWLFHYVTHVPPKQVLLIQGLDWAHVASIPLSCSSVCADFYPPGCKHPSSATNQCSSGPAGKLRFAQSTPGPTGPTLAQALIATTVPMEAGTSCWWTPCLQEADLGWSSGVRYYTLPHSPCVPEQQRCPFPHWERVCPQTVFCAVCLAVSLAGKVLWRRRLVNL